jgi:hypothetical protein
MLFGCFSGLLPLILRWMCDCYLVKWVRVGRGTAHNSASAHRHSFCCPLLFCHFKIYRVQMYNTSLLLRKTVQPHPSNPRPIWFYEHFDMRDAYSHGSQILALFGFMNILTWGMHIPTVLKLNPVSWFVKRMSLMDIGPIPASSTIRVYCNFI